MTGPSEHGALGGMMRVMRLFWRVIAEVDRRLANHGLTSTERRVLLEIARSGSLEDKLVRRELGMEASQFSRGVKALVDAGLVAAGPTPRHASQRRLRVTLDGKNAALELRQAVSQALDETFRDLPRSDQIQLVHAMGPSLAIPQVSTTWTDNVEYRAPIKDDWRWIFERLIARGGLPNDNELFIADCAGLIARVPDLPWPDHQKAVIAHLFYEPVGAALLTFEPEHSEFGRIGAVYVSDGARRHGIGRTLLRTLIDTARTMTMIMVEAEARVEQADLAALYLSEGFCEVEKREGFRYGHQQRWRRFRYDLPMYEPPSPPTVEDEQS